MPSDSTTALRQRVTRALTELLNRALREPDARSRALAVRAFAAAVDPEDGLVRRDLLERLVAADTWLRYQLWLAEPVEVARRLLAEQSRTILQASAVADPARPPYDRARDTAQRTNRAG